MNCWVVLDSIQHPRQPQGEFLAYGVFYAIGQDVGVGEVGNLLERLITSSYLEIWKSFSLISDFCSKSVSIISFFVMMFCLGGQCIKKGGWTDIQPPFDTF